MVAAHGAVNTTPGRSLSENSTCPASTRSPSRTAREGRRPWQSAPSKATAGGKKTAPGICCAGSPATGISSPRRIVVIACRMVLSMVPRRTGRQKYFHHPDRSSMPVFPQAPVGIARWSAHGVESGSRSALRAPAMERLIEAVTGVFLAHFAVQSIRLQPPEPALERSATSASPRAPRCVSPAAVQAPSDSWPAIQESLLPS